MHVCMYACTNAYLHACMHMSVYEIVCRYVRVCVHKCIFDKSSIHVFKYTTCPQQVLNWIAWSLWLGELI
jgi:hypothetical protein